MLGGVDCIAETTGSQAALRCSGNDKIASAPGVHHFSKHREVHVYISCTAFPALQLACI